MKVLPNTVPELLDDLEASYPPVCKKADESLEEHSRYAGKVELVAELRRRLNAEENRQQREGDGLPKVIKR